MNRLSLSSSMQIREAKLTDRDAIAAVLVAAFESDEEVRLVDRLVAETEVIAATVAEIEGRIVGHMLLTELPLDAPDRRIRGASLAPLSVIPANQRRGIGSSLTEDGLRRCETAGVEAVVVLGHPTYYPRFGFSAELAEQIIAPWSGEAFMALELEEGVLGDGQIVARYPPPFLDVN